MSWIATKKHFLGDFSIDIVIQLAHLECNIGVGEVSTMGVGDPLGFACAS